MQYSGPIKNTFFLDPIYRMSENEIDAFKGSKAIYDSINFFEVFPNSGNIGHLGTIVNSYWMPCMQ